MKLQEGGRGVAGTSSDFAGVRSLGDSEQQADLQIAPEEPGELLGKFGRTSCEQSGRLSSGHDFAQGGATSLACYRVERTRYFGGVGHLGDRQSEYGNDRGLACLADDLRPERSQHLRQGLAIPQYGQVSVHVESLGALADAGD
jgi:hypothetical protein